jgi:hypothetical protein
MERLSVTVVGTTLALVLAATAQAAPVQISWTDHWAALTPKLYAEGFNGGTSHYVSFSTPLAMTSQSPAGQAVTVLAANLTTVSSAPSSTRPDRISADYTLSLMVTDETSNAWKVLLFHGQLNGTFWRWGSSLSARFLPVNPQTFFLGRNFYAVAFGSLVKVRGTTNQYTLDAYLAAVQAGQTAHAAAAASPLTASPLDDGTPVGAPAPQGAPEPCTLLLAGLGAAGLAGPALWQWRRRRRT